MKREETSSKLVSGRIYESWLPHESLCGLIVIAGNLITEFGMNSLQKAGLAHLSLGRIGVLSILTKGPETQAALSLKLGQKPPSMAELLQRLLNDKLVEKNPDKNDKRKTNWKITAKGRAHITKAEKLFKSIGGEVDSNIEILGITKKELDRFKEILNLMNQAMIHFEKNKNDESYTK